MIDNGGSAYPAMEATNQYVATGPYGQGQAVATVAPIGGMSLLDWFAGQALVGMISAGFADRNDSDALSDMAYMIGHSMIAVKRKQEGKK